MLEPAMIGSGINKACKTKLFNIPQSLEPGVLDNIVNQIARYAYKSINRIIDYFSFICLVDHLKNSWYTKLCKKNAFLL
jgi:hypothetical protein